MSREKQEDPTLPAAISSSAGVVAGGVLTSGAAMGVAGTGGLTGYLIGTTAVIANITCGTVAAIAAATVVAGPILGGLAGYGIYRGVKKVVKG